MINSFSKTRFLFTTLLFLSTATVGQTTEPSVAELDEQCAEHVATLITALKENDSEAAVNAALQIARIERRFLSQAQKNTLKNKGNLDQLRKRLSNTLDWLIDQNTSKSRHESAIELSQERFALTIAMHGKGNWQSTNARLAVTHLQQIARLTAKQQAQLIEADRINGTVRQLFDQGKIQEAKKAAINTVNIRSKILGEQHPDTAASLGNLAVLYKSTGENTKALPLYRQTLNIDRIVFGEQHPSTAISLNNLAVFHLSIGDNANALPLLLQSLEIRRKVLGPDHPDTATAINNLAGVYKAIGDNAKALPLLQQSLEVKRKSLGQHHPHIAIGLTNVARVHVSMGNHVKAIPLFTESLEIRKKALGDQHPDTVASFNELATLFESLGENSKALLIYQESLEIRRKVLGEQHPDTATNLNKLALLYKLNGDYAKALPLYQQSLEIRRKVLGEQHSDTATSLNNLAVLHQSMGDYANARPLYEKSLEIRRKVLGEQHPDTANSYSNLGTFDFEKRELKKALPLLQQSLKIYQKVLGEEHHTTATILSDLSTLHYEMGDYTKATAFCQESLEIRRKVLGEQHPDTAFSLNNLAVIQLLKRNNKKALSLMQQSHEVTREVFGNQHPRTAFSLSNLGKLHKSIGDYSKAEPLMLQALHATRSSLEATALIQSERQQLAMAEGLRHQLDSYLNLASDSKQFHEQAYRELLAWKGATLVRQRQMRKVAENTDVAPLFKELQQTATRLATLSRMTPDPKQQSTWRRQITDLTAEKERLEIVLSQKSSEFRAAKKRVSLEDMLAALPKDAVIVDFFEYWRTNTEGGHGTKRTRSLLAFVIRHDIPIVLLDLGPVALVSDAIDTWRETFGTSRDGLAAGGLLRETVWAPVEGYIADAELVLVSADGAIGRLPIGALPGKKAGSFLLEDYRLAMLPVPQLLPALVGELGRKELSGGLLLMGDVNYNADPSLQPTEKTAKSWKRSNTSLVRGGTHFSALTGTAGEIATIKEVFTELFDPDPDQIKTLKQTAATEQAFRESAPKFYNLHLATHGFFAHPDKKSALVADDNRQEQLSLSSERERFIRGHNPGLLSGLAFSGANRKPEPDKDDGILTADEIASLSLDGVNLVVLSACETGLGEVAGGEGLLGVQRAFQVAGADSTVASLWEVGDVATRRLMERFYRNYWEKEMSKLDALREAQLFLLHHPEGIRGDSRKGPKSSKKPKTLSPQFWAAFQLSGDWR